MVYYVLCGSVKSEKISLMMPWRCHQGYLSIGLETTNFRKPTLQTGGMDSEGCEYLAGIEGLKQGQKMELHCGN